jgi:ribulose-phosphate 3-epimerase
MSRRDCIEQLKEISPAILPSMLLCDFGNLASEIEKLEAAGVAALHLDVMDGVFVPNFSYGMTIVHAVRTLTELPLDVHLMMVNPEKYVKQFYEAGASIMTIHAEAVADPVPVLESIRELGAMAGIAINPRTPVSSIENCLGHVDLALVMSVNAGFGGQEFDPSVLTKLDEIRELTAGAVILEIDGGINVDTIGSATQHGAELLVAGSAVFKQDDYAVAIEKLMAEVEVAR